MNCPIMLTTSPYSRKFNAMYGGQFEQMQGLVYDCFNEEDNVINEKMVQFPVGTRYIGGIDWGYTDPFVLVIRAITPEGRHYQVSEFYKPGMTLGKIKTLCKSKMSIFGVDIFWCDPSRPDSIKELQMAGIPAQGANNDIITGIDAHYELVAERNYKIIEGTSPNTIDEYETYHYPEPEDLKPDQNAKKEGIPVDQNNHCMDANRYITKMTYRSSTKKPPRLPGGPKGETIEQKLKRLKKPKKTTGRHTETW